MPLFHNESSCKIIHMADEFDLHENKPVGQTHFHMNCFARKLVLTQKQKAARETAY